MVLHQTLLSLPLSEMDTKKMTPRHLSIGYSTQYASQTKLQSKHDPQELPYKLSPATIGKIFEVVENNYIAVNNMATPLLFPVALAHFKLVNHPTTTQTNVAINSAEREWFQGFPLNCSNYEFKNICDLITPLLQQHSDAIDPKRHGYYITSLRIIWSYVDSQSISTDALPSTEIKGMCGKQIYDQLFLMQERRWRDYFVIDFCEVEPLVNSILSKLKKVEAGVLDRPRMESLSDIHNAGAMEWEDAGGKGKGGNKVRNSFMES